MQDKHKFYLYYSTLLKQLFQNIMMEILMLNVTKCIKSIPYVMKNDKINFKCVFEQLHVILFV